MKIYNVQVKEKIETFVTWKVPLLVSVEERDYTHTTVSSEDLSIYETNNHQNETDAYDGSDASRWNKYLTNVSREKIVTFEEYEDVHVEDHPSRLFAMHDPLTTIKNPQSEKEKVAAQIIDDLLGKVSPFLGKKIYIGKEGRFNYFMKPEAVGDGIRMNCFISISAGEM